jgi:hypothetical protein
MKSQTTLVRTGQIANIAFLYLVRYMLKAEKPVSYRFWCTSFEWEPLYCFYFNAISPCMFGSIPLSRKQGQGGKIER